MAIMSKPSFAADISGTDVWDSDYDIVLVALGYESRSRHLACSLKKAVARKFAIPFEEDRTFSYSANLSALVELGYKIVDIPEKNFLKWWCAELSSEESQGDLALPLRICIDISSLTRLRLAHIIEGITNKALDRPLFVDFVYTIAKFTPPLPLSEAATICGPVSPYLAGWPEDPDKPVAAVIGLGYEFEKAIGAIEYLEPATRLLLKPVSKDIRFDEEVDLANQGLLDSEAREEIFFYPIDQPTQCLELLDALIYGLKDKCRVIAIPFGPKIFALCCMLIACRYYPEVGVWRISAESSREVRDQLPSDVTVGLRVRFAPHVSKSRLD